MKIEVISFGQHAAQRWHQCPIRPPDRFTLYQEFDLRLLPDPHQLSEFGGVSGLDKRVQLYILSSAEMSRLAPIYWSLITTMIELAQSNRFTSIRLAFMCGSGFQRSVAMALSIAGKISEEYEDLEVTVRHLGLEERGICQQPEGQPKGQLIVKPV